jgi:hypothetical protein
MDYQESEFMDLLAFKEEDDEQFSKREARAYREDDPCKH